MNKMKTKENKQRNKKRNAREVQKETINLIKHLIPSKMRCSLLKD